MKNINIWHKINSFTTITTGEFILSFAFMFCLYLTSHVNYVLFHSLVEISTIIISFGIFIVAWNARTFFTNHFLLFISIAYAFISIIDVFHTLSYQGTGIFAFFDATNNLPTQLWVAARFLQASTLLIAPFFLTKKMNLRLVFGIYFLTVTIVFISIFDLRIFPVVYFPDTGLTTFKIASEYLIAIMLAIAGFLLYKKRKLLDKRVFGYIFASIIFTIASEICFTAYFKVFDLSNMLGHYLRVISFLLIYKTMVETGVQNPLSYIFRNLEQSTQIIKASELKFRSLVELSVNAIILTNGKAEIDLWNSSAEKIFGWTDKEVIGKSLDFLIPTKVKDSNDLNLGKIIKESDSNYLNKMIEFEGIRKSGEVFPLEISFSSWEANGEKFICYIMRDISERKMAELELLTKDEELEKLVEDLKIVQLSMENAFAHIIITDENGSIVYANKSAEELTGFTKDEMIGKTPSLWGKQMPQQFYNNFWKTIKNEKVNFAGEIVNKRKNGELYTAEIRVAPVLDDENDVKFFVALERDITEQKEVDKAKTEFISLAAHQLRTPLSTISIITEMLLKDIVGNASKENRKYLKNIFSETKDMTEMIEIFLNVSRIEMGKFPIVTEPLKLYDVIEKTVKDVTPQINSKKIHFKKDYKKSLPTLYLDKNVMKIILENLLTNAIKYSPKDGKVSLSVTEDGKNIIIEVKDYGIGIPQKDQNKIFTKMFRSDNTSKIKSEGSGLGLYLVKNLVEQSGYNIKFTSLENEGTTFIITIPKNSNGNNI